MLKKYAAARGIRGVNIPHRKHTAEMATEPVKAGEFVAIPLSMHIGAPALPVVEKGQKVYVGTLIGKAASFVSANVHSSVSGVVERIDRVLFPDGGYKDTVVIKNDGLDEKDPSIAPPVINGREDFINAVMASGLVGLGGAGFPTHVKLTPPKNSVIDTLIVNAAECEPYITSDYREMIEAPDDIVEGLVAVMNYLSIPRAVFAVEDNKPKAIAILREKAAGISGVSVKKLGSRYPQGAEKMLIANTVKRAVPIGGLPADVGCVVLNVGSLAFIGRLVHTGMPLVKRRVTIDGGAVAKPGNYMVPFGISVRDLIERCGGYSAQCRELIMGGPMMGTALYSDEFPILKNTNAILALTAKEMCELPINPCIHCGRCQNNCPMRLSPVEIAQHFDRGELKEVEKLNVMACVECGCCTYVCPAKRPLTQRMRMAKVAIRKAARK